ncbi:MAG TPA: sigma-54 dependent transcriptional regulator [Kofleriaceae bacterium]|nr:sigma-54 dependent transcriptional regulator [Kofleriaceae bacterium]
MSDLTSISVGVFGRPGDRSGIRKLLAKAGAWPVIEVEGADVPPEVAGTIGLFLLVTNGDAMDGLFGVLGARPEGIPLVVIGKNPAHAAHPDVWLPTLPAPALLAAVIGNFISAEGPKSPWRRKADMILGTSSHIRDLLHSLDQLAPAHTPVLIEGESGVGKELVARALHFSSPRAAAPFIAINCGAIPATLFEAELFGYEKGAFTGATSTHVGAFEAADKGTLFLDEIGEMPMAMQVKLLRVLQTSEIQRVGSTEARRIKFRLVTATNRDLAAEVAAGRFREDLFYRIHVYPIRVAPLRERPEDIPPIVHHYLSLIAEREKKPVLRLSSAALERLLAHSWPGNVRELVNLLERAAVMAGEDTIDAEHIMLPTNGDTPTTGSMLPYKEAKQRFETEYYSQLMRTTDGNVSLASKVGQKTRKEIYDALKRLGLDAMAFRSENND